MPSILEQIFGTVHEERAVLSVCAVPGQGGAGWTLVHGTLLIVPDACAGMSWAEWRRRESEGPAPDLKGPLPTSFLLEDEGWMLARTVLDLEEADRWLELVRASFGQGADSANEVVRLPQIDSVPALEAELEQPKALFQAFPDTDTPAASLIAALERPAQSLLWRGTSPKPFVEPQMVELAGVQVFNPTLDLVGVHVSPSGVAPEHATAAGLLVGRAEGRAWIRTARGSGGFDAFIADVGWDPQQIDLADLELTHEEWLDRELVLSTRFRLEDLDTADVDDLGSCSIEMPTLGRKVSHELLLHTLDGELLDRNGRYPLVESVHITPKVNGHTLAPIVTGVSEPPPGLEERMDRVAEVSETIEQVVRNGVQARMIADRQTALDRLAQHLRRARGELLILDRFFGQDAREWRLLDDVPVPVRVLTAKLEDGVTPTIAPHVQARFRPKARQHERAYVWDGGGLVVGGSPTTFGQGPVRMTRIRPVEAEEWRTIFESLWGSDLYRDVPRAGVHASEPSGNRTSTERLRDDP